MAKKRSKRWRAAKARRNENKRAWEKKIIDQAEDKKASSHVIHLAARIKQKIFKRSSTHG